MKNQTTKQKKQSNTRLILSYVVPCLPLFAAAFALSILNTVCQSLIPQVIRVGVDGVLGQDESKIPAVFRGLFAGTDSVGRMLLYCAIAIVIIAAVNIIGNYGARVMSTKGSEKFVKSLRDSLFDHIQHLPFSWFVKESTGDIIQRCTSDVETIQQFVTQQLIEVIRIIFLIVFYMAIMFRMNVTISAAALAFIPVIVGYSFIFFKKIAARFRDADVAEGQLSTLVQEDLTGVRVVRAFGREPYEQKRFDEKNTHFADLWIRLGQLLSVYWSTGDLISGAEVLTVTVLGIYEAVSGRITVGEYITFISYNASLTWPIRSLGRIVAMMSRAGVSIDRIAYILNAEEEKDLPQTVTADMHKDIVFDHVSFRYEGGGPVLKDVSFTIPAGKTFAILGNTGSGKSTLIHLLDRLYELPEDCGKITIGGVDIRRLPADYLRSHIGVVLQEPFLFSGTIRDNICITEDTPDENAMREAARIACVDSAITSFTDGYDTVVGERGVTLSGGQKQRVAIARMLVEKAPVMIFDDSFSAVDTETDAMIRESLKESMGDATVILIAHRVTTLMQADTILVLENGQVAEMGTHSELVRIPGGIYHRIYDIQMGNEDSAENAGEDAPGGEGTAEEVKQ
ncbi:MAG: ABC transporter ATP-binding protein [Lachnospiraceae bacterium]|jgi:ATP-binding cassette subfamily B protein